MAHAHLAQCVQARAHRPSISISWTPAPLRAGEVVCSTSPRPALQTHLSSFKVYSKPKLSYRGVGASGKPPLHALISAGSQSSSLPRRKSPGGLGPLGTRAGGCNTPPSTLGLALWMLPAGLGCARLVLRSAAGLAAPRLAALLPAAPRPQLVLQRPWCYTPPPHAEALARGGPPLSCSQPLDIAAACSRRGHGRREHVVAAAHVR
jgi:hypothetical protein